MNDKVLTADDAAPAVQAKPAWRDLVSYQGMFLGVICAGVTLSLLVVDRSTSRPIGDRLMEDRLANLAQVMPADLYENNPLRETRVIADAAMAGGKVEVYPARRGGVLTAAAFQVSTIGYGGPISLMIGVDAAGNILGVRVLAHKETPGLADKIEIGKSPWITRFNGLSLDNTSRAQWAVKKDGGIIDQFSGATITPRAVVKGIREGLEFYARHRQDISTVGGGTAGGASS